MNLLKRLVSLFSGGGAPRADKRYLTIYVLSRRCNEPISGQVDLLNELSKDEEGGYAYFTRKVLHTTGEHRCFSQVEIQLHFNQDKQVVNHEVEGGRWLTSDEYSVELARFNAPPPEEDDEEEAASTETSAEMNMPKPTSPAPTPTTPTPTTPTPTTDENKNA